jgi:indolepyruvate ferredoxin oxidoreductase beta subunit
VYHLSTDLSPTSDTLNIELRDKEITMKKQDILLVGVGGQGIILASDILGAASIAAGYDVKKTDTIGMAQRGGSVVSHVRIADRIWSPLIKEGEADILVAFEKLEAARWTPYLKSGGLAVINDHAIPPLSVSLATSHYPSNEAIKNILKQQTNRVLFIDGTNKAKALGDIRTFNIFMLGYISSFLPVEIQVWQNCLASMLPAKILDINSRAFEQGRKESPHVNL